MNVVVYSTSTCPWCRRVKEYLTKKGVPYVEKRVDEDYAAAMEMVKVSQQQGVPVTVVDNQVVVGYDVARLEKLLADSQDGRVPFGASVADASSYLAKKGQIPIFGAYVGRVSPGSPASKAGLVAGDIITEINVRPIARAEDLSTAMANLKRGDRVSVVWTRGDRQLRSQVIL